MKEKTLKIVSKNTNRSITNLLFSYFFILLKLIMAIVIAMLIPLSFLVVLLIKEPQEIEILNKFIDNKITETGLISNYKYNSAKIGIDKRLRITYNIYNLEFDYEDNFVMFPKIGFKFKIKDLIKKLFILDEIKINKLIAYVGYNQLEKQEENNLIINIDEVQAKIYEIIRYLHRENKIINSLSIGNSSLYIFDKNNGSSNKIDVIESHIKLSGKLNEIININTKLKLKINDNMDFVNMNCNCSINENNDINCNLGINNFKVSSIDFASLSGYKKDWLHESLNNIDGLFNFELNANFSNYINFIKANFNLYSNSGNFLVRQVFGDRIIYKNLSLDGETDGANHIKLNSVKINFISERVAKFYMTLDCYKNRDMKIDIDINNAPVNDIRVLWPVFLDDLGIRDWVVEHISNGYIDKAFAYMDFDYIDGNFVLDSIKSEVDFVDTSIDFYDSFPIITSINAKAIFSKKDMNVYIDNAKIADTVLYNAKVYLDFEDEDSTIYINTNAKGNAYELFYFVDNKDRKKVKDIVTTYINGYAFTEAVISVPIAKATFKNTYIKIYSEIIDNNTVLFKDNSSIKADLIKKIGSNSFESEIDCKNALISYPIIEFDKIRGDDIKILLDIVVNDNRVLLSNIRPKLSDNIDFLGNGNVEAGILSELNFDYFIYNNNKFSVLYTAKPNENPDIFVNIDKLNIKKDFYKEEILNFLDINHKNSNNYKPDLNLKFQIDNITINNTYNLNNIFATVSLEKGELKSFKFKNNGNENGRLFINVIESEEKNIKYNINIECENFGAFLSSSLITNNVVYGNFYFNGNLDNYSKITGKILINEGFSIITNNIKDAKLFNYILNNENVSENVKNNLKDQNMISFEKLKSDLELLNGILYLNDVMINSSDIFGVGINGSGFININSGMIDFRGFIIPIEKLNKLLGLNKLPIINQILFSGEDKGLITVDYTIFKENYDSEFIFKITKANGINNITPINSMLKFFSGQR